MTTKNVVYLAVSLVIACLLCILLVDQPLPFFSDQYLPGSRSFFNAITTAGEIVGEIQIRHGVAVAEPDVKQKVTKETRLGSGQTRNF